MTLTEIAEYLDARNLSPKEFWEIAMGGDMSPLPADRVTEIARSLELANG